MRRADRGTQQRTLPTYLAGVELQSGDIQSLNGRCYITHSGLLRIAKRNRCAGIHTSAVTELCSWKDHRWVFRAVVFKNRTCKGFSGFGDADPSNISPVVRGAEMRVAETRAVNRALRKAYGIGLCSIEEIGSGPPAQSRAELQLIPRTRAAEPAPCLRDQLRLLIRRHQLDGNLVKAYAADFCSTQELRQASKEQIEEFIRHLANYAEHDRDGLMSQLSGYAPKQEGAA